MDAVYELTSLNLRNENREADATYTRYTRGRCAQAALLCASKQIWERSSQLLNTP